MKALKSIVAGAVLNSKYNGLCLDQNEFEQRQNKNFDKLKVSLEGTSIYADLELYKYDSYADFAQNIKISEYEDMESYIEDMLSGQRGTLFKNKPSYFGLTSGTSGQDSKKIPYNNEMINVFINSQKLLASVVNKKCPELDLINADRISYGSNPKTYEQNGVKFGYISGILNKKTSRVLKKKTFPSDSVLEIEDWNDKLDQLVEETVNKDIKIASGIPSYIIAIFELVLKKTGKQTIREVWPNLTCVIYGATPIEQYREKINALVGHDCDYFGIYAATEAPIGVGINNARNTKQIYAFSPDLIYTFTEREGLGRQLGIGDIEEGSEYYLNITTPAGFINYSMKDVVRIKTLYPSVTFEVLGRQGSGMNLAAEKTNDEHVLDTVVEVGKDLMTQIDHFFLAPESKDGVPLYNWTLFSDGLKNYDKEKLALMFDKILCEKNPDYQDCREDNIIGMPQINIVSSGVLHSYFDANKDRGQFKMKTIFNDKFSFEGFINQTFPEITSTLH